MLLKSTKRIDKKVTLQTRKRLFAFYMKKKHEKLIMTLKGKDKIRVCFLVIFESIWKLDPIFKKMLDDPMFEPIILICPYVQQGNDAMNNELNNAYNFFNSKGYPTIIPFDNYEKRWVELSEFEPDILFFTTPHDITVEQYYFKAFSSYISFYIPYSFEIGQYEGYEYLYDQQFHYGIYKIYCPHESSFQIYKEIINVDKILLSGYPYLEDLTSSIEENKSDKTHIIWAPHHTLKNEIQGNHLDFLDVCEYMKYIAIKYRNKIFITFKPHPLLFNKLLNHHDFSKKVHSYYDFWRNQPNTEICTGDYKNLFNESDALIHNCGSFLAEYTMLGKPSLLLINKNLSDVYYNAFGIDAFNAHYLSDSLNGIENFIKKTIDKESISNQQQYFINKYKINHLDESLKPSSIIIEDIKSIIL